jgi:predicted MFS family arabinose efflux permease
MGAKLFARVFGGTIDRRLHTVLLTLGLGITAMYAFWSFFAIWAVRELEVAEGTVGLLFLGAACVGIAGGLLGGRLSDRLGRKPVIVAAALAQAILPGLLLVPGGGVPVAMAVMALLTFAQPIRGAAQMALIADLVPDEERERAFGAFRIVFNFGALGGPILGACLVALGWPALHGGVAALYLLSFLAALRLPSLPPMAAAAGAPPTMRTLARDRLFALVFAAALRAATVYNAFETVLPVSLTQSHGLPPSAWGILFVVNPLLVTLFQLRVTRWTASVQPATKLAAALLLMGCAFLPLLATATPAALVLMMTVFVVGEMLWSPTADALASRLAPPSARGAYMGTLGIAMWTGGAIAPALGLQLRAARGDAALWLGVAVVGLGGALLYARAARGAEKRTVAPALADAA